MFFELSVLLYEAGDELLFASLGLQVRQGLPLGLFPKTLCVVGLEGLHTQGRQGLCLLVSSRVEPPANEDA